MKSWKKLLALLMALTMVLALVACGSSDSNGDGGSNNDTPKDDRTVLDVFAGVTVKFKSAINGFGNSFEVEYDYTKVDYDKSNTDIKNFLEAIEFSADSYTELSNGDKIVVNASWSKSTAETLGVKLLEESKEFTVEGMYEVYRSIDELSDEQDVIDGITGAIDEEVYRYIDWEDYLEEYDRSVSYRYYVAYSNDGAGSPYINMIYVTAVVSFESPNDNWPDETATFLGYNYLYQEYWEMRMAPHAEQSDRVSEAGELSGVGGAVKLEEFFPN